MSFWKFIGTVKMKSIRQSYHVRQYNLKLKRNEPYASRHSFEKVLEITNIPFVIPYEAPVNSEESVQSQSVQEGTQSQKEGKCCVLNCKGKAPKGCKYNKCFNCCPSDCKNHKNRQ